MRIAIIGSGVSGIAAARALARFGHEVIVFEKADRIGGVWGRGYPGLRLQNVAEHYRLSDFPWPFVPDQHPTARQILDYLDAAVNRFGIDVRLGHEVDAMEELSDGWRCDIVSTAGTVSERFDYVVIASGQYGGDKPDLDVSGRERFAGTILTERDFDDLAVFDGRSVVVVGFGKTALDLAALAAGRAAKVHHVFRSPRWMIPKFLFGRHISSLASARHATFMIPSWVHSYRLEAFVHRVLPLLISAYWKMTEALFRASMGLHRFHRDAEARERMRKLEPSESLPFQMRAAAPLAPDDYCRMVRDGTIVPHRGVIAGFSASGIQLLDGQQIAADVVVLAIGYRQPSFPFLPEGYRRLMSGEPDEVQLYRHIIHPSIPRVGFAGFNHSFLHIPVVEVAMIWYGATIRGDLTLPEPEVMTASAARVVDWKRGHTLFERTRSYGIGNRVHQYLDVLLMELGVRHRRKRNGLVDRIEPYYAADYAGVFQEYIKARNGQSVPRASLPYDT